jgi:hypothetical protein
MATTIFYLITHQSQISGTQAELDRWQHEQHSTVSNRNRGRVGLKMHGMTSRLLFLGELSYHSSWKYQLLSSYAGMLAHGIL